MTGGFPPGTPVIVNVSVWHWVARLMATAPAGAILPPTVLTTEAVSVLGPAITKVLKSIRSFKKTGQNDLLHLN